MRTILRLVSVVALSLGLAACGTDQYGTYRKFATEAGATPQSRSEADYDAKSFCAEVRADPGELEMLPEYPPDYPAMLRAYCPDVASKVTFAPGRSRCVTYKGTTYC